MLLILSLHTIIQLEAKSEYTHFRLDFINALIFIMLMLTLIQTSLHIRAEIDKKISLLIAGESVKQIL